ncbi:AzlD domain-containing protein [Acidimicrobiia bacterium EGI L10123]|uniref:AzlD domain-containing protein n=1 Tax=Salinilacustrithrix flava TaxID=2957203 RepID=UPI003D7C2CCF|nr:AzlD domain-containing protein [Acidimicrobiia bacterium EGI L10123]
MSDLAVLAVIGAGTYLLRSLLLIRTAALPGALQRRLPFVGPSVLAAIAAQGIVAAGGGVEVEASAAAVLAVAATAAVWTRRKTFGVPLVAGMAIWWVAAAVLSSRS